MGAFGESVSLTAEWRGRRYLSSESAQAGPVLSSLYVYGDEKMQDENLRTKKCPTKISRTKIGPERPDTFGLYGRHSEVPRIHKYPGLYIS